ncbi:MAG: hypothetical protein U9Q82_05810 [Chloroflexota bacterium]|nr:hypothetical protein [Chloroflexota bacterium]
MYRSDLFSAVLDDDNPRGHPILAALLYAFCPAAARWWMAGAEPVLPFDPVWEALSDAAGGRSDNEIGDPPELETMKDALNRYRMAEVVPLDKAVDYIDQVDAFRRRHQDTIAPELYPSFPEHRFSLPDRHGLHNAIDNMGGDWNNFFVYIRTWAFLTEDWEDAMHIEPPVVQQHTRVGLTLPGIRRPVWFPVMVWSKQHGRATRVMIGLLVKDLQQDALRFSLIRQTGGPKGDKPWPSTPELWAFDRVTGEADVHDPILPTDALGGVVKALANMAENGPYPPMGALQDTSQCRHCGYTAQCFASQTREDSEHGKRRVVSPLALDFDK